MKFGHLALILVTLAALPAAPQTQPADKKTTTAKKAAPRRKGAKSTVRPASRQLTPTPERYKEIQQALADKGYLKSAPNGIWDADSTEALRQFQTDQKLTPSGKITASSLIGLGLGPKTAGPATGPAPAAVEPPPKP